MNIRDIQMSYIDLMFSGFSLTHRGREAINGSDNSLSSVRHRAIIQTKDILLGKISGKFQTKFKYFQWEECIWKCRLQTDSHFLGLIVVK